MRYHVWVSQLRTLDLEVEAATSDDAERQARSRLQYSGPEVSWLESATVIKIGRAEEPLPRSPKVFEPERQLLSLPRAAEYLGVSRTTVYKLLRSGDLESVSVGRRRFVTRRQLDDYIARQEDH